MFLKRNQEQDMPLNKAWTSFYQQQQQEGEANQNANPPSDNQQQQQQQAPPVDDPFKDIPMDNLDDATKAALEKVKTNFTDNAKQQQILAEKVSKLEGAARQYQSIADKALSKLKHHGLTTEPNAPALSPQEQQQALLESEFTKNGMPAGQAKEFAKVFNIGLNVLKPGILSEVGGVLGPAMGKLNTIAAERYLEHFGGQPGSQTALQIPGVRDATKAIIDTMIQNNQDINANNVTAAIQMAVGEALMKSGGNLTQLQQTLRQPNNQSGNGNTNTSILASLMSGNLGGGGNFIVPPNDGSNNGQRGMPVAANEDTARAAAQLAKIMDRQIKK